MSQRVAITGSSGLIGGAPRRHTSPARGDEVLRLVRREPRSRRDEVRWDPARARLDPARARRRRRGRPPRRRGRRRQPLDPGVQAGDPRLARRRHRTVASALAELAGTGQRSVLVSGSAIGYLRRPRRRGPHRGAAPPGTGFLCDVVRAWEAATQPAVDAGLRVVHARTGLVLSPRGGAMGRVLPLARLGLAGPLGSGRQYWPWITLHDEVRALAWAIDQPSLSGHGQPDRTAAAAAARGHQGRGVGTGPAGRCCPRRPWR